MYVLMWEGDTSGKCPDVDKSSTTITNASTSCTITGLEELSNYTINVTATNAAGNASTSTCITVMTSEYVL